MGEPTTEFTAVAEPDSTPPIRRTIILKSHAHLTQSSQYLIDILHANVVEEPDRLTELQMLNTDQWEAVAEMAIDQRIASLVYCVLMKRFLELNLPISIIKTLSNHHRAYTMHNMKLQAELARLIKALNEVNIQVIVLKGLHLASCVYEQVGQREMDDVDLLVSKNDLVAAREVLLAHGYVGIEPNDVSVHTTYSHHLPPLCKPGVMRVELHWNITKPGQGHSIDPEPLWNRAEPIIIAESVLYALSIEDLLLHLCHHTSYHHEFSIGLRPFCDIATVITSPRIQINWDLVVSRCEQWQWQRGVYLCLRLTNAITGVDIPLLVLQNLRPNNFEESLCDVARSQICTPPAFAISLNTNLAMVVESDSLVYKLQHTMKSIFIRPDRLADRYNLPQRTLQTYLYYPVRVIWLVRNNFVILLSLLRSTRSTKQLSQRKSRLTKWLNEDK